MAGTKRKARTARALDDQRKVYAWSKIQKALHQHDIKPDDFLKTLADLPDERGARTPPPDVVEAGEKAKGDFAKFMELLGIEDYAAAGRKFGLYNKWKEAQGE